MDIKEINKYSQLPTNQIPPDPSLARKIQVFRTNIIKRPIIYPLYKVILIILATFLIGLAASKLPIFSLGTDDNPTLSLHTKPSFLPSKEGILRSYSALIEGEIKKIEGNKITLVSGDDEIVVKLSERFVKSEEASKEATDSSGRRVPPRPVLPDLKVGDKVQVGLGVINGETVVTSIFVDTTSR